MKTLWRQALREWERAILWVSVVGLSLVVVFLLSRLAGEKAPNQATPPPAHTPPSYLNEETAFDFLQSAPASTASPRNPFAFSYQTPEPSATAQTATPPEEHSVTTTAADPAKLDTDTAKGGESETTVAPPPPPRRSASILYRGLYNGGGDATRQRAFVSTREAPGDVTGTAVLAPGQTAAGITVKRFTPTELVVSGPTGVEVSIAIGTQVQIALE